MDLPKGKLSEGWYEVEASCRDKQGETILTKKIIQIKGNTNTDVNLNAQLYLSKDIAEPLEQVQLIIKSNIDSIWALHTKEQNGGTYEKLFNTELNGARSINVIPLETDRGGIVYKMYFVRFNRFYAAEKTLYVPFTNKDLKISYETYRDKTLPGANEKWKVKISGYKADKVAAEYLTAMYDASLDEFNKHRWFIPYQYNIIGPKISFVKGPGFESTQSNNQDLFFEDYYYAKNYDRFIYSIDEEPFWWIQNENADGLSIGTISQVGNKNEGVVFKGKAILSNKLTFRDRKSVV